MTTQELNTKQQIKIMDLELQMDVMLDTVHDLENAIEAQKQESAKVIKRKNCEIDDLRKQLKEQKALRDKSKASETKQVKKVKSKDQSIERFRITIGRLSKALAATSEMIRQLSENYDTRSEEDETNLKTMVKTVQEVNSIKYSGGQRIGDLIVDLKKLGHL